MSSIPSRQLDADFVRDMMKKLGEVASDRIRGIVWSQLSITETVDSLIELFQELLRDAYEGGRCSSSPVESEESRACENCLHWGRNSAYPPLGECRLSPPSLNGKRWPETYASEFCGKWASRAPAKGSDHEV